MMFQTAMLRRLRLLIAVIVALAATGFGAVIPADAAAASGITTSGGFASTTFSSPIGASAGDWRAGVLSPNGSRMYLIGGSAGVIKAIPTGGGTATSVAVSGSYFTGLGLSPDGTTVYSAQRTGSVLTHNADGTGGSSTFGAGAWIPNDLVVSPTGEVYVITINGVILRWTGAGTDQTTLATLFEGSGRSLKISPDGNRIAFTTAYSLGIMNIDGTGASRLLTGLTNPQVAFGPDGSLYYGDNSGSGSQSIIHMNADGTGATTIATGFTAVSAITVNSAGRVFVQDATRTDIVELLPPPVSVTTRNNVAAGYRGLGVGASIAPTILQSYQGTSDYFVDVAASADGSTVYAATAWGYVMRMTSAGYDQAWLSQSDDGQIGDLVVSPDEAMIYATAPEAGVIIKFSTTPGGPTRQVVNLSPYTAESLAISPDGTTLYLAAGDRILRVNIDGTGLTTVGVVPSGFEALNSIAISPDGSTLYAGDIEAVWSIDVATGTFTELAYTPSFYAEVSVLPDGRLLILDVTSGLTQSLVVLDANLSNPTTLATGTLGSSSFYSVFADATGDVFLMSPDSSAGNVSGFIELDSTVPASPTGVTVTDGGSTGGPITVHWTAPTDVGASALTGYTVTASSGGGTCTAGPSDTSCTIGVDDGLTFGAALKYRVVATNSDGSSIPSAWSAEFLEYNDPQGPAVHSHFLHNTRQVGITWDAPGAGSPPATGYVLRDPITGAYDVTWYTSCWCISVFGPFPAGHSYTFDFYATTAYGNGLAAQIGPYNFPGAPTAPTEVSVVPGDRSATVSWTPYPGVYPAITSYTVTASPGGATCSYTVVDDGTNSCVVSGLTTGSSYTFAVVPTSSFSDGAAATSASVEIDPVVPDAPTSVTGIGHDSYVDVYWDAPEYDGGSTITGYWAQAYTADGTLIEGAICSTTGTACGISGLTNGTDYRFSVRATNDVGYSEYATLSSTYAPIANVVPDAPTGVGAVTAADASVIPSAGTATVSWTAPAFDGGTPITGYWAQAHTADGTLIDGAICSTTGLSCTIARLAPATTYTFSVRATNDVGYSEYATLSASVTTPGFTNATNALVLLNANSTVSIATTGLPVGSRSLRARWGSLPAGMSFVDNGDGTARITGTPTVSGKFTITLQGGVGPNQITQRLQLYVAASPSISVTGLTTSRGRTTKIRITTAAGGYQPGLSVTGLPSWATFTDNGNGTGEINGVPDAGGATSIRVTANGYPLSVATSDVSIVVNSAPIFTSAASTTMVRGVLSSFIIRTSGGHPTGTTFAVLAGTLQRGLIFVDNGDGTATISGTPTLRGVRGIRVRATAGSLSTQQMLVITVN